MYDFEFIINEYFCLMGGQIGFVGTMKPADFPVVSMEKYKFQLFSNDKLVHVFNVIGEEIPVRTNSDIRVRALRTTDNIQELLKSGDNLIIKGIKKQAS